MFVLKSRLVAAMRLMVEQEKELEFRADAYLKLLQKNAKLETDYSKLEGEIRELKLSLPVRDAQGRFSKR
ncbi:hypothetical protein ACH4YO_07840 [Streptomyces noursei]|uniref:hypothetical protein n=1 Tax=Streptomyces noursei TaxID=1971 RepID=UPI0033C8C3B4